MQKTALSLLLVLCACGGTAEHAPEDGPAMTIPRTKAAGWAAFEGLTSTQMNTMDQAQVLMTDSRLVPDYAFMLQLPHTYSDDVRTGVYSEFHDKWVFLGGSFAGPVCFTSVDGLVLGAGGSPAINWSPGTANMAASDDGVVVAVGTTVSGDFDMRVRRSADAGATWTSQQAGSSGVAAPFLRQVIWHQGQRLFIAVGNTGSVFTSPDGLGPWLAHSLPAGWAAANIVSVASNGDAIVAFTSGASSSYLYTRNALDWSDSLRSLPSAVDVQDVVWAEDRGMFIAPGLPTIRSADGLVWVSTAGVPGNTSSASSVANHKGFIIAVTTLAVYGSADYGATWRLIVRDPDELSRVAFGQGRFIVFNGASSGTLVSYRLTLD